MNSAKIVSFDVTFLILSFFIAAKKTCPTILWGTQELYWVFFYFLMLLSSSP